MLNHIAERASIALFLLFLLSVMTGCTSVIEAGTPLETLPEIRAGTTCPLSDEQVDETFSGILCFLSDSGDQLVRVSRELTARGGQSRPAAVLEALLAGPNEGERGKWPEVRGTTKAEVECSGSIATVLLPPRYRGLEPNILYALRFAIAESILSIPGMEYVNVLVGDREEGVDLAGTIPAGTFIHHADTRISSQYAGFEEIRTAGEQFTSVVTLYYPSKDGTTLLPVARNVQFENTSSIEYMNTLLAELGKGSDLSACKTDVPMPLKYLDKMPEIIRDHNGKDRVMTLFFSEDIKKALEDAGLSREAWLGMIAETLLTFVPNVDGLEVSIGQNLLKQLSASETLSGTPVRFDTGLIVRSHFSHLLGTVAIGYRADADSGKLTAFEMCIPAKEENNAHTLLAALLDAEEARPIMPDQVDQTDVLAVRSEREQIVVNLSERFGDGIQALSPETRKLSVYAMVNTLTEGRKDKVIFFFGGAQMQPLDGLEMRGSFLRAPGMIKVSPEENQ